MARLVDAEQLLLASVPCAISVDDVVLLGGSIVVGLSQGSSDYDLYVLRSNAEATWSAMPTTYTVPGITQPVEVEEFAVKRLLQATVTLRACAGDPKHARRDLPQELLERYSAILTATPLLDRCGRWPDLLTRLDTGGYARGATDWHQGWCDRLSEIAGFAIHIADYELADAATRSLVAHAVDALLIGKGEIYFSPKYRFEKARRAGLGNEWCDEVWRFQAPTTPLNRHTLLARLGQAREWVTSNVGLRIAADVIVVPSRLGRAKMLHIGNECLLVLGSRAWVVGHDVQAIWADLAAEQPWLDLRQKHAELSAPAIATVLRFLVARGLLALPAKVGRWATWV